jgi:hypothetical protein
MAKKALLLLIALVVLQSASAGFLVRESMYEGQSKIYITEEGYYNLTVASVSDAKRKAVFEVNGMRTKPLGRDDRDYLEDGSRIIMRSILFDEDGEDYVEFYFSGSGKGVLPLDDLSETEAREMEEVPDEENIARKLFDHLLKWMFSLFRKV